MNDNFIFERTSVYTPGYLAMAQLLPQLTTPQRRAEEEEGWP